LAQERSKAWILAGNHLQGPLISAGQTEFRGLDWKERPLPAGAGEERRPTMEMVTCVTVSERTKKRVGKKKKKGKDCPLKDSEITTPSHAVLSGKKQGSFYKCD
jgi:hypothetical protein